MRLFADTAQAHAEWAYAAVHWTPQAFWAASPADLRCAWRGWMRLNGQDPDALPADTALLARMMERFPD